MSLKLTSLDGGSTPMSWSAIVNGLPDLTQRILGVLTDIQYLAGLPTYPCCKQTTTVAADVLEPCRRDSDQEPPDVTPLIWPYEVPSQSVYISQYYSEEGCRLHREMLRLDDSNSGRNIQLGIEL